jgi:hypothetical protein
MIASASVASLRRLFRSVGTPYSHRRNTHLSPNPRDVGLKELANAAPPAVDPARLAAGCGNPQRTPGSSHANSPASSSGVPLGTPVYCTSADVLRSVGWDGTSGGRWSTVSSGARASRIIITIPWHTPLGFCSSCLGQFWKAEAGNFSVLPQFPCKVKVRFVARRRRGQRHKAEPDGAVD